MQHHAPHTRFPRSVPNFRMFLRHNGFSMCESAFQQHNPPQNPLKLNPDVKRTRPLVSQIPRQNGFLTCDSSSYFDNTTTTTPPEPLHKVKPDFKRICPLIDLRLTTICMSPVRYSVPALSIIPESIDRLSCSRAANRPRVSRHIVPECQRIAFYSILVPV
jgi:hypothetical protein